MNIAGVLLAAGTSSRMGRNKLLLKYKDHTVIEESLSQLLESNVGDVLIITGFESRRIEEAISKYRTERTILVYNGNYQLGRAESIKCAIGQINDNCDAVLFMVADKPGVKSALIDRAIERFTRDKPAILYVKTPEGRGHPIIFARRLFDELMLLSGDLVGENLIARHRDKVAELNDRAVQLDIDTEEDYRLLIAGQAF